MSSAPGGEPFRSGGVVRLLTTASGRVLCLAGDVGPAEVDPSCAATAASRLGSTGWTPDR